MRHLLLTLLLATCLLAPTAPANGQTGPDPTTVYLVRHAEKDLTNPSDKNPALTAEGQTRARHLADILAKAPITAIYSTPFTRTLDTVKPLADRKKLAVVSYSGADYAAIRTLIDRQRGKTILICGHSDTLIPIIRSTGAVSPVDSIPPTAYDNLFRIVIRPDGKAQATVTTYK